jgi:hypothetical protein
MTTARADIEIQRFIERSSQGRDADQERPQMWAESERRYHDRQEVEQRAAWIRYHECQAEALENTAAAFAAEHRARAEALREARP